MGAGVGEKVAGLCATGCERRLSGLPMAKYTKKSPISADRQRQPHFYSAVTTYVGCPVAVRFAFLRPATIFCAPSALIIVVS